MIQEFFYDKPYQVIFLREVDGAPAYEKGIVFHTWIVAARDGATFSTKKVIEYARRHGVEEDYAIVEGFEWLPFPIN